MEIREGYVYHIKNEYFTRANDDSLMQNKESGGFRPALLCFQDRKSGLLWFVPLTSKYEKFEEKYQCQKERYGNCLTITLGEYGGKNAAFLLQNLFPALPEDIDHIHQINGIPRPVKRSILKKVQTDFKRIREIMRRGKTVCFTDVARLEDQMLRDLTERKASEHETAVEEFKMPLEDQMSGAQARCCGREAVQRQMRRGPPIERD